MLNGVSDHLAVSGDIIVVIDALRSIVVHNDLDVIIESLVISGDAVIFLLYVVLAFHRCRQRQDIAVIIISII